MSEVSPRIGVYVCHCGTNIAGVIDVKKVVGEVSKLPGVVIARDYIYMCSDPGQDLIVEDIKKHGLDRVIVASCTPMMHERTFRRVLERAGINKYMFEMVNIREQCSWAHEDDPEGATEKAIALITMAVAKAHYLAQLEDIKVPAVKRVLVIGAGIAGMTASLALAESGYEVVLVEKEPSIGGNMAKIGRVFPTMDCSPCILTPVMVEISRNPRIKLYTYSEIENVSGTPGKFKVIIKKKPRYVKEDVCVGCGICIEKCPVKVESEFDEGVKFRKAIFIPFPQAVPRIPVIDTDHCLYFQKGVCKVCERFCPTKAIDYEQKESFVEEEVGAIIVATGYKLYDISKLAEYGFGKSKYILTGLQLERIVVNKVVGEKIAFEFTPKSAAIILCAGSRDEHALPYCCRFGCAAGLKHALYMKGLFGCSDVYLIYQDIRAFGKGYEAFYRRVRETGVKFIQGKPSEIEVLSDGKIQVRVYNASIDEVVELKVDTVILEVGIEPSDGTIEIAKKLKIPLGPDNFILEVHPKLKPVETFTAGILVAGCAQGPKDIPDTISQAKAAAATASEMLATGVIVKTPLYAVVDEAVCDGCGVCAEVCPFNAIEIVEKNGKKLAKVDAVKCKGGGLCLSSCHLGAIDMSMNNEEQLTAYIKAAGDWKKHPKILLIADECGGYQAADLAGLSRFIYPAAAVTMRVSCAGRITPRLIIEAFKAGFDGVVIAAGPPEVCHYVKGATVCSKVVEVLKKKLNELGIEEDRLVLKWTVAPAAGPLAATIRDMTSKLEKLGPVRIKKEAIDKVFSEINVELRESFKTI